MDKNTWKKISQIFDIALTLTPEHRETYIQSLCRNDARLKQELEEMLDSIEASDQLLEHHLEKNRVLLNDLNNHLEEGYRAESLKTGSIIQDWKIVDTLGRGGMGEVYRVERTGSDIHQQGALKILRHGLQTEDNLRRFRLEKQILAGLQHPNIASLISGGLSEDGRPFLVMEYVEGIPIDAYCDKHNLSLKQRLHLFETVCEAVQHAHKNLIVHRDLKPENILVTDSGRIKILDFGIAKLLDQDLYHVSAQETQQFRRVMSLNYAAPEQLAAENITTSTDVYALGNLLYELLTGLYPHDFDDLTYSEIEQIVLHQDPPAPSRRLRNASASINNPPDYVGGSRISRLKGDLDAIILKALRKEPELRYQSASRLGEDISHYLQNKPVTARNGTLSYRASKFMKRYRWGVAAAIITLFSLIGGFAVAYWQARVARMERDQARLEKDKAEEVTQFLTGLFEANHPDAVQGDMPTARDLLDAGYQRIDASFLDNPVLRSEMQALLGKLYIVIDEHEKALPLLEESIRMAGSNGDIGLQTEALRTLSQLYNKASRYEKSLSVLYRAARLLKEDGHIPSLKHANIINELRSTLTVLNKNAEALKITKSALEAARPSSQLSTEVYYKYLKAHGTQLRHNMRFEEANAIFREALSLHLPPDVLAERRFEMHEALLYVAYYSGNQQRALALHDTLLNEVDELFPKVHGARTHLIDIISRSLIRFDRLDQAEKLMREGLELQKEVYPDKNRYYLAWSHVRLGLLLRHKQKYPESLQHIKEARHIFENIYGKNYHLYGRLTADIGDLHRRMGNYEKSQALITEALTLSKTRAASNPTTYQVARLAAAKLAVEQQNSREAMGYLAENADQLTPKKEQDGRLQQEILTLQAQLYWNMGNVTKAETLYKEAVTMGDQVSLFRGIAWPRLLTGYARFLIDNSRPEAKKVLDRALIANQKLYGENHPVTQSAENLMAHITPR